MPVDDVELGDRPGRAGFELAGLLVVFVALIEGLGILGIDISRASASAVTREAALGKRSAGSFARPRMITSDKAGEIFC